MRKVCVFCGSSSGKNPGIQGVAGELGRLLARHDITLIYGGASVGLMGILADSTLEAGGRVIGVIPKGMERKEITHRGLTELYVVDSMHDRKEKMGELADGFIGLPGGLGTLETFFEVLSWAQLGLHQKPIGLLNACGYYDSLLKFLERSVSEQFVWLEHKRLWHVDTEPSRLLNTLITHQPPVIEKWIGWKQI